jgi:hypothetical protein
MKTYRNNRLGFEIKVPVEWEPPVRVGLAGLKFRCGPDEDFNIVVGPLLSQTSLEDIERHLAGHARERERGGSNRNVAYRHKLARRYLPGLLPLVSTIDLRLLEVEGDGCSIEQKYSPILGCG